MQPATAMSKNAPGSLKTTDYTDTISLLFNNYKGIMREISERVIDCESLIDLICDIDYALPCTFPVIFRVETGEKTIKGKAGIDWEDNQILYVNGKAVDKQDCDLMVYREIVKMLRKHFVLDEKCVVYLSDSSFSGRQFRVNNSLPLMDGEGNPIKFDDDDEEE